MAPQERNSITQEAEPTNNESIDERNPPQLSDLTNNSKGPKKNSDDSENNGKNSAKNGKDPIKNGKDPTKNGDPNYTTKDGSLNTNGAFINNAYEPDEDEFRQRRAVEKSTSNERRPSGEREETEVLDFDDILPYLGEFGLYQRILFLLMIPFTFFVSFVYFSQIFMTLIPDDFWCMVPELQNMTVEERLVGIYFSWIFS